MQCRGKDNYDNFLSKGYAQTAISTNVSRPPASSFMPYGVLIHLDESKRSVVQ